VKHGIVLILLILLGIALVGAINALLAVGVQYVWAWIDPSRPMPFWVAFVAVLVLGAIFGAGGSRRRD
jgi:uncharacterized membrane protein YqjE